MRRKQSKTAETKKANKTIQQDLNNQFFGTYTPATERHLMKNANWFRQDDKNLWRIEYYTWRDENKLADFVIKIYHNFDGKSWEELTHADICHSVAHFHRTKDYKIMIIKQLHIIYDVESAFNEAMAISEMLRSSIIT